MRHPEPLHALCVALMRRDGWPWAAKPGRDFNRHPRCKYRLSLDRWSAEKLADSLVASTRADVITGRAVSVVGRLASAVGRQLSGLGPRYGAFYNMMRFIIEVLCGVVLFQLAEAV